MVEASCVGLCAGLVPRGEMPEPQQHRRQFHPGSVRLCQQPDVAQDDHNTAMGTAGTAAHASASGRQTEQADAACPVSGVRDICHVNLIPTPALFQQGISNAAAENP